MILGLVNKKLYSGSLKNGELGTKIKELLIKAMRARDEISISALKQIQAELVKATKVVTTTAPPSEWEVLNSCIRRWRQAIIEYETLIKKTTDPLQGDRLKTIIEREQNQLAIVEALRPPQYTEEELITAIRGIMNQEDGRDLGIIMKRLKATLDPARYTTGDLAAKVKNLLLK